MTDCTHCFIESFHICDRKSCFTSFFHVIWIVKNCDVPVQLRKHVIIQAHQTTYVITLQGMK